ncbi:hypothetical protein BCV70DRAFT_89694 [Testicularia cyperi]|uniref:Uncharacterized protein n=1 Tax=Testicularia cyperi TaxID=1882483 RepID=A0A317XS22_9BASI|nr:hypothetical protein BCV70DRAFT_89694 [Testicularia cyperi]
MRCACLLGVKEKSARNPATLGSPIGWKTRHRPWFALCVYVCVCSVPVPTKNRDLVMRNTEPETENALFSWLQDYFPFSFFLFVTRSLGPPRQTNNGSQSAVFCGSRAKTSTNHSHSHSHFALALPKTNNTKPDVYNDERPHSCSFLTHCRCKPNPLI